MADTVTTGQAAGAPVSRVMVAATIANAVHHATGIRVRDLPITLDKLIA
ncbi:hypothetical protein ACIBBB_19030 [Streptomyces sp. NPDC051217]